MLAERRLVLVLLLALAATPPVRADAVLAALVGAGPLPPSPWHVVGLPQQNKPFTRFSVVDLDGRRAVKIEADLSYGDLVHRFAPAPAAHLAWQWRLERPLEHSDLHHRSGDDSAAKVCVFFDEPLERLSFGERQALRFFRARANEPIPTATVCYVWDTQLPPGTALDNPFTRRMRYIVVESGTSKIDHWIAERRDIGADFTRVFGSECPSVPPVIGVLVGADADSTQGHSVAYVNDLSLGP